MEEDIEPTADQIRDEPMLQLFRYKHLKPELRGVSRQFCALALTIVSSMSRNPERTVSLRKLREAKDTAVTGLLWTTL